MPERRERAALPRIVQRVCAFLLMVPALLLIVTRPSLAAEPAVDAVLVNLPERPIVAPKIDCKALVLPVAQQVDDIVYRIQQWRSS